ncbi:MAG: tetratricopeptide repeat protein [Candidatus Korobacteraceae bacterium]
MRVPVGFRFILIVTIIATTFAGCSRDPNVRKQKYLDSGQRYFEKGKYREAAIEFTNAIKIDPGFAEAHYQLAQTYLKVQEPGRAYQELVRTVELQPQNYSARSEMAELLIGHDDLQLAQTQVDWLLQNRPDDPTAHLNSAYLLAAGGDVSAAIAEMQKAIALAPSDADLHLQLALLLLKKGQPDEAEANLRKALELNPKAVGAWLMLGTYHQTRGSYGQAEQEFRQAIDVDPKNPEPRAALVRLFLAEGKKTEAEEYLKQVKRDFPDNSAGYRMLGDYYRTTGDLDKATAEYAALYQEHPKDIQVKNNYTQLLIQKNRFDEARKLNDEVLKVSPADTEALLYRARLQIAAGDASGATVALQTVIKSEPNNAAAHYELGVAFQSAGDLANAKVEWLTAVRIRPDLLEAQRSLALLAMRQGDMGALEAATTQLIRLEPASAEGYSLRAVSRINRQQYAAAEEDIRKAIEVDPRSHLGYVQLGNLKFVQKQYNEAGKAYQDALDRDPNSTDALRGLVNTYLAQNQVDKALAAANTQIAKSPNNSSFYFLLGNVLFRDRKDLNGAETAFHRSVELDKNNSDAVIQLGQVQVAKGEVDQAIATYQQAVKDHPNAPAFYTLLGGLYQSKRDWTKAQEAYQKTLALKPGDPVAANNLANVMLQNGGNIDVAMSLAETARRGMPDSPNVADTLGWIYYQKGVYGSAVSMLQEALKLQEKTKAPDNANIHYHLGLAYQKTQQPALARQQFERVLKINPNYSEAAEVQKQLDSLKS